MDFQCARNLSAINRAQQPVAEALLHIGECTDCLNREVILPVSDSDETEQLLEAARTDLLRVQTILQQHHLAVEERLRAAQVAFLLARPVRRHSETESSALEHSHDAPHRSDAQSDCTRKGLPDDGHSYDGTVVREGISEYRRDA